MAGPDQKAGDQVGEPVWDLGTRLFHWGLVICVTGAWLLGEFGPNQMTLHFWFGYGVAGLLVFRLIWGLIGPRNARFVNFIYGPSSILNYAQGLLRRQPSHWNGHNPLGSLSVFAMLAALIVQVGSGLVADADDYINIGPLAKYVSTAISRQAVALHDTMQAVILLLVVLHIATIVFYRVWKRENLVKPMITGRR
ncbi:MAG: cytochrome b/b6 domain-containing protein [Paracoccus sp. (in: a-proteobacteria)]|uniref:cytochrome b/b6 domain-containing protein n=1 Tax=Paracoccus sp. TaxID=267 RepID=UPI0026E0694E|nr:cytochrome b/b6 domain-containing protein [Paracoccus sp. (in: a-proteobacteria)]MDO5620492.1 cytochrome b/b6 domain-containing protein [Paracoccus sp. (in: a-proteobacteria)]